MKYLLSIVLVSLFFYETSAQRGAEKAELMAYNVLFSGITIGIGAVINSPKTKNKKKVFLTGFWQGGIGGLLKYSGKELIYQVGNQESLYFVWPSRIVHSAGLSICENASYVRPFLKNWQFYLGFLRFDFSVDNSHPFRVRFLPEALYAIYKASQYGNFNISKTFQTGSIIFQNRDTLFAVNRSYTPSGMWAGASFGRALTVGRDWGDTNFIIAHEIIHEFQFNEYQIFNSFLSRPAKKIVGEKTQKIFTKYIYADIPYFLPVYSLAYKISGYGGNFFEFEAYSSSLNR